MGFFFQKRENTGFLSNEFVTNLFYTEISSTKHVVSLLQYGLTGIFEILLKVCYPYNHKCACSTILQFFNRIFTGISFSYTAFVCF